MTMKNKKGLGLFGIALILVGLLALYFIYQSGLINDFINFIKGIFT